MKGFHYLWAMQTITLSSYQSYSSNNVNSFLLDSHQGLCDSVCQRNHVLQVSFVAPSGAQWVTICICIFGLQLFLLRSSSWHHALFKSILSLTVGAKNSSPCLWKQSLENKIIIIITFHRVANPIHAVANVDDYSGSARLLAATTLRNDQSKS